MNQPRILLQLDCDQQPSSFDAVVAIDSNVDHLLPYANVEAQSVVPLVHGAIFTRGPEQLKQTAIFVGGSDVGRGDEIGAAIRAAFVGPMRVSVMLDGNGSNTTAAAAVLCAARHLPLEGATATILGGTGPVGVRAARLLLQQGAAVHLVSRNLERAEQTCHQIASELPEAVTSGLQPTAADQVDAVLTDTSLLLACGAAGVRLLSATQLALASQLQVAIDLNAVPPAGLEGIDVMDKAMQRGNRIDYGAIGVGGLKMKLHRAAIQRLFSANDLFLDTSEIFQIGLDLEAARQSSA